MAVLSEPAALYRPTERLHIALTFPDPSKFPAKEHARSVARRLPTPGRGLVVLQGMPAQQLEDSDQPVPFRQRRDFLYLSGVTDIPGCTLTYALGPGTLTLFIPPLDPASVLWAGMPLSAEQCLKKYDVDEVTTTADLAPALAAFRRAHPDEPVYTLPATAKLGTDTVALKPALNAARCYKSAYEVDLIRHANAITAAAHAAVLAQLPHARSEAHLEAAFTAACIARHARAQPYAPIVGAGRNAAVLHYTRNAAPLAGAPLVLVDAAAEWHGYCADVTRTLPLTTDGRFPPRAQHIYDLVLAMQAACIARAVASADLRRLHALAHVIAVRGLLSLGILRLPTGTHEEDILAAGTSRAFFPHGLGHLLGLDVHDVGPPATQAAQAACLGVYDVIQHPLPGGARVMAPLVLEPGMVVTIEPGIYFQKYIITPFLNHPVHAKFIDRTVLDQYWDVGGVRIEDDILILPPTAGGPGNENLSSSSCALKGDALVHAAREAWAAAAREGST